MSGQPKAPHGSVLVPGVCSVCGCTEDEACPGGCYWADDDHTLCSNCLDDGDDDLLIGDHDLKLE